MGQQQLLLLVLAAIIVGISVVVGINMFNSSSDQANIDAVRQDLLTIGSQAQSWYKRPDMMGGGGNSFSGLDFNKMSFPADSIDASDPTIAYNSNGDYELSSVGASSVTATAIASSAGDTLTATITQNSVNVSG